MYGGVDVWILTLPLVRGEWLLYFRYHRETRCGELGWINLGQDGGQWQAVVNMAMNVMILWDP
jgi:hypothetical protein